MALSARQLKVGDTHSEQVVDNLTRTQIVQYAGASGDYNPIHTDEVFTTKVAGYPSVFAHGMLTMGMTGKMLTNYVGDGRLTTYGVGWAPPRQSYARFCSCPTYGPTGRAVTSRAVRRCARYCAAPPPR